MSHSLTQDPASAAYKGPECGSLKLECTQRFERELTTTVASPPFEPASMREAAQACAHEAKLKGIDIERLIAELGDCLRNAATHHQHYAELRKLVLGWVLAVYFPAT